MSLQRVFFLIMILALGCRTVSAERGGAETVTAAAEHDQVSSIETPSGNEATPDTITDMEKEQIELNKTMLLTYSDEAIRINAASLLLLNSNSYAREVLIDTLDLTNNSLARMAICNAIIKRSDIPNKKDFIEPLLKMFSTKNEEEAKLVADTMMIYPYSDIGPLLDKIVTDPEQPSQTRINVIAALKKVWEKNAVIRLYRLVDDRNQEVAAEAGKALKSLGFEIGTNSLERSKIISDVQNKEIVELQKDLLINQDQQITKQKDEFETLRKFTKSVLEDAYLSIGTDDTLKGKFLKKYLGDSRIWVKSWAIEKVRSMRMAVNSTIPPDLEPAIIKLVSDSSPEIRLATTKLIGLMRTMQSVDLATPLLAQFDVENDDQVKIELLDILGIVCSAAHNPDSKTKITLDIKQRVLNYSSDFLSKDDNAKAKVGAKVLKKLIEKNGLQEQEVTNYLTQLADRYSRKQDDPNSTLKSELLDTMVALSTENSTSKQYARDTFSPFFQEALNDNSEFIRETAITGLGYVNKANALEILRERVGKEPSERVRSKIIDLAKEVGGREDLNWLAKLISSNNQESIQAWDAMITIFGSVEIGVLNNWESQLISPESIYNLTELQKINFLKIALAKTPADTKPRYYEQIANRCLLAGLYDQAVNNFNYLYDAADSQEEKNRILPNYLDACLKVPNAELVKKLVEEYLATQEFNPESQAIQAIDSYFKDGSVITDKNAIIKVLNDIILTQPKPAWNTKLQGWNELLNKPEPESTAVTTDSSI